jgi:hypothetical protein
MLPDSWIGEGAVVGKSEEIEASGLDELIELVRFRRLLPCES